MHDALVLIMLPLKCNFTVTGILWMVFRSSINITIQGADKRIKTKTFSDLVGLPGRPAPILLENFRIILLRISQNILLLFFCA